MTTQERKTWAANLKRKALNYSDKRKKELQMRASLYNNIGNISLTNSDIILK